MIGEAAVCRWRLYRAPHCVTQDSLRQAFEGSVFILAPRYGELLNMLFLAIMFAGTIPVVVPLLCVGLAGTYKLELLELLRWAERPVQEVRCISVRQQSPCISHCTPLTAPSMLHSTRLFTSYVLFIAQGLPPEPCSVSPSSVPVHLTTLCHIAIMHVVWCSAQLAALI